MITLARFSLDDINPHIGIGMPKLNLQTSTGTYRVKTSSSRLECLKQSQHCVRCSRKGNVWALQVSVQKAPRVAMNCFIDQCPWCALRQQSSLPVGTETPHLNLFHVNRKGLWVLMTQDHIFPKHAGGSNGIENLQTMCTQCNSFKGGMLPHEYEKVMSKNERAIYSRRVDGGSSPTGGLSPIHSPLLTQAHSTDCAAE